MRSERLEILEQALPKMRPCGYSVHEYGDWKKLDTFGWAAGLVPEEFRRLADHAIWWPRNDSCDMAQTAVAAGWQVETADLDILKRDGVVVLRRPPSPVGPTMELETALAVIEATLAIGRNHGIAGIQANAALATPACRRLRHQARVRGVWL